VFVAPVLEAQRPPQAWGPRQTTLKTGSVGSGGGDNDNYDA